MARWPKTEAGQISGPGTPARELGTTTSMPKGVIPTPTPVVRSSGIPSSPMDRTRPETLDQLRRRSGGR
jgi:hypothetical protein